MKDRALNLLMYIRRKLPAAADLFEYEKQVEAEDYDDDQRRSLIVRHREMLAESEFSKAEQICTLLDYLVDTGCLARVGGGTALLRCRITATGWDVLEPPGKPPSPPARKIGLR